MIRFPNRTAQTGVYKDDTLDYVDLSSGAALAGMVTFSDKATDDGWGNGDQIGVLIEKSDGSWQVWTALWDSENDYLTLETLEDSSGTLTGDDAVNVRAVITQRILSVGLMTPSQAAFVELTGTTYTIGDSHAGKVLRCTSSSAVTLTLDEAATPGIQFLVVQAGSGAVSIARGGTDTINGGSSSVAVAKQFGSAYVYQVAEGAWEVIA
jgi:hypothetical protein